MTTLSVGAPDAVELGAAGITDAVSEGGAMRFQSWVSPGAQGAGDTGGVHPVKGGSTRDRFMSRETINDINIIID
jgi:hypothetical protein